MGALREGSEGPAVRELQLQLAVLGRVSGRFDPSTADLVRRYQADGGLKADGVVGDLTRGALAADTAPAPGPFRFGGSYALLVGCENHVGQPYVPSRTSGVTLVFGYDLKHQRTADVRRIFAHWWTPALVEELCSAIGLEGPAAVAWLEDHDAARWSFGAAAAGAVLPLCAARYWAAAVTECPELPEMPPRVQTVLMSATYSLWTKPIKALRGALRSGDWVIAADVLEIQGGRRERRDREAALLRSVS